MIDRMLEQARELVGKSGETMVIEGAREGAEIRLESPARSGSQRTEIRGEEKRIRLRRRRAITR